MKDNLRWKLEKRNYGDTKQKNTFTNVYTCSPNTVPQVILFMYKISYSFILYKRCHACSTACGFLLCAAMDEGVHNSLIGVLCRVRTPPILPREKQMTHCLCKVTLHITSAAIPNLWAAAH